MFYGVGVVWLSPLPVFNGTLTTSIHCLATPSAASYLFIVMMRASLVAKLSLC